MSGYDPETSFASSGRTRDPKRPGRWGRRLAGVLVFLVGVAAVFAVVAVSLHLKLPFGINGTSTPGATTTQTDGTGKPRKRAHHAQPVEVTVSTLAALLKPTYRAASVPFGAGGALFLGGYDSNSVPTDAMQTLAGASVQASGTLPAPTASAVAATLGSSIYLFGGSEGSTILEVTQTGATVVGSLPNPTADAAIATVHGTAYIIGGYTGATELNTVVAFSPSTTAHVVATLPTTLRFATATTLDGEVYIAGGESNGIGSAVVYRFDPATDAVTTFARLPKARDREAAASIDDRVVVMGGASATTGLRTRAIYVINPHNGFVHRAGLLPVALSDIAAVDGSGQIIAAGGLDGAGAASSAIYSITVKH
jgi:hypothetical protein